MTNTSMYGACRSHDQAASLALMAEAWITG